MSDEDRLYFTEELLRKRGHLSEGEHLTDIQGKQLLAAHYTEAGEGYTRISMKRRRMSDWSSEEVRDVFRSGAGSQYSRRYMTRAPPGSATSNPNVHINRDLTDKYLLGELGTGSANKRDPINYNGGLESLLDDYEVANPIAKTFKKDNDYAFQALDAKTKLWEQSQFFPNAFPLHLKCNILFSS